MVKPSAITLPELWDILEAVKDPEIPTVSLVDLGVIYQAEILPEGKVIVSMTPTFAGCPAIRFMQHEVERVLEDRNIPHEVRVNYDQPWNSNLVTARGRARLKAFGLAPPPQFTGTPDLEILLNNTPCPFCDSHNTELRNPFGPTLCRSMHYCNDCLQMFEQFKPVG